MSTQSAQTRDTILVALDGSVVAEAVIPFAQVLAQLTGFQLRLLTALDASGSALRGGSAHERSQRADRACTEAQAYLDAVAKRLQSAGIAVSTRVIFADPVTGIMAAAAQPGVQMVALATHGRGGAQRLLLGSVADKLLRLGHCATFIVRARPAAAIVPVTITRILVPLDGSPLAETALKPAQELAAAAHATLVLVRAEPLLWQATAGELPMVNMGDLDEQETRSLERYLDSVKAGLPTGIKAEIAVYRGLPSVVLEDVVLNDGIDLVVMTSHGRGGLRRLALGSIADRLVRLGAPTLLVRPPASEIASAAALGTETPAS